MAPCEQQVDLLVVGGGAAGLAASTVAAREGLRTLLCEKTDQLGGTTSTSGGTAWIPGSSQSRKTSAPDTIEAARRYLQGELGEHFEADRTDAFLEAGPAALDYFERNTELVLHANNPYPDYHPERPGGAFGGRALTPPAYDGRRLGGDLELVRPPIPEFTILGGMMVARKDIPDLIRPFSSVRSFLRASTLLVSYFKDRLHYGRGTRLVHGTALVGMLVRSARVAGVEIATGTTMASLIRENGRVAGAIVRDKEGDARWIEARRGVVLATGGCAASAEWRKQLLPDVDIAHALAFEGATGEGLEAGMAVGGSLDDRHPDPFFWMPASTMVWRDGRVATYPHIRDRPKPGLIAVDASGRRFVNESASYHDFVQGMLRRKGGAAQSPVYLICDRRFVYRYGLGVVHPIWQRLHSFVKAGYLVSALTLHELAARIGADQDELAITVARHNAFAARGVDEEFGRGSSQQNRFNGDPLVGPNPNLASIATPPFFALKVQPAPLGSSVGLRTDCDARVLDDAGDVIEGLYACGNDMSSIMRGHYPGPGITIGPALVFAFRAAMHAAGTPFTAGPS